MRPGGHADDDKVVDPVGTWKCEYEIGGQQRTSTLKIKKDGDNLTGTMSWPDQDETKLKDLKLKDGTLTFSAVRKLMGDEIPVEYKLKVEGDKLKGKGGRISEARSTNGISRPRGTRAISSSQRSLEGSDGGWTRRAKVSSFFSPPKCGVPIAPVGRSDAPNRVLDASV